MKWCKVIGHKWILKNDSEMQTGNMFYLSFFCKRCLLIANTYGEIKNLAGMEIVEFQWPKK